MRLPIDTSRLQFLVVAGAEPLKKFEEGKPREAWAPRVDTNGEVLWRVQLVALGDGEADIIRVVVAGRSGRQAGRDGARRGDDGAGVGDGGPQRDGVPGRCDPLGELALRRGEGGGLMTRRAGAHAVASGARTRLIALVVGVAGALWRLRLELGLVAAVVVAHVLLAGLVGDVVAAAVVLVRWSAVVPGGARWSAAWLLRALRAARVRRAWWRAWTDCELPRVRAGRVSEIPAGELVRVRASRGSSLEAVEQRARRSWRCACRCARSGSRAIPTTPRPGR